MRTTRSSLSLLVTGALLAVPLAAAPASAAPVVPTLVAVRAAHHPGFDRVVLTFRGGLPRDRQVGYVDRLVGDASGLPVRIAGRAVLRVRLSAAQAHDAKGPTAPSRVAFALPNVMTVVRAGDFEAVTTYGIGLARHTAVTVSTLSSPSRLVVDVRAGFPTVTRKVWFLDRPRFVAGRSPYVVPVLRQVPAAAPATGLLDRLFAGPTPAEATAGLRLVRSQATGFTGLAVSSGVARVRLTGGCSSGGSTVSVADEIVPTLRQLATVDVVKVYDPAGRTGTPGGRSDSIPACLEP